MESITYRPHNEQSVFFSIGICEGKVIQVLPVNIKSGLKPEVHVINLDVAAFAEYFQIFDPGHGVTVETVPSNKPMTIEPAARAESFFICFICM